MFSHILVFAPNFPNRNATLDREFEQLDVALAELAARVRNPAELELLEQCRAESRAGFQLFKEGRAVDAQKQMRKADETLAQAGKLRKGKASAERVKNDYQDD